MRRGLSPNRERMWDCAWDGAEVFPKVLSFFLFYGGILSEAMTARTSHREFLVALLIAAGAHVGVFFVFVLLLLFDLLSARPVAQTEPSEQREDAIKMRIIHEVGAMAEVESKPESKAEVKLEKVVSLPETPAFVQTRENQASAEVLAETQLIGEHNTSATSDNEASAGASHLSALSGIDDPTSSPKAFNSDFSAGGKGGSEGSRAETEVGRLDQAEIPEEIEPEESEAVEQAKSEELASLEETLAVLDEVIDEEQEKSETLKGPKTGKEKGELEEEKSEEKEFETMALKTRVAGVFNAKGKGSLNVANTPLGSYEASLLSKLETAWQNDNRSHRRLNAPGQIVFSFSVDLKGQVVNMKHVLRVGASDNQWGRVIELVDLLAIPKMPSEVVKELKGEALELTVTLNY